MIDFRLGRYQDVLADIDEVSAVICDPPYSWRTHDGQCTTARDGAKRRDLSYAMWSKNEIIEFLTFWKPKCSGWFACMSDSVLTETWRECYEQFGLTGFSPIPCTMPGMTVRLSGDGPSSWTVYLNVARPKNISRWGTLKGEYRGTPDRGGHIGGKPIWLMSAIIRDYSRPGDLICDPCAGGATTLIAAASQGRRAVGCEMDEETYKKAQARIDAGYTEDLFIDEPDRCCEGNCE